MHAHAKYKATAAIADRAVKDPAYDNELKVGSGFRLSALGIKRCRRLKKPTGVIIGVSPTGSSFRVLLDGRKQPVTLHESYIEPDAD